MKFKDDSYKFENLFRPNYELKISISWMVCSLLILTFWIFSKIPIGPVLILVALCIVMSALTYKKASEITRVHQKLNGRQLEFIDLMDFIKMTQQYAARNEVYLGNAFDWTPTHTQRAYEMLKQDTSTGPQNRSALDKLELKVKHFSERSKKLEGFEKIIKAPELLLSTLSYHEEDKSVGYHWIHGLALEDRPFAIDADNFKGHTLIVGTTGAGKTRLFDLLITQAICRGETVIIIDPKGDQELHDNAKRTCDAYRQFCLQNGKGDVGDRFFSMHPGHPDESTRINFLANSDTDTELATRIRELMPGSGGNSETFKDFAWKALNSVVQCLQILGEQPTLVNIKINMENQLKNIGVPAILKWAKMHDEQYNNTHDDLRNIDTLLSDTDWDLNHPDVRILEKTIIQNYSYDEGYVAISSVLSTLTEDPTYFAKTTNSVIPVLVKLTSGPLESMLSATSKTLKSGQRMIDMKTIIERNCVLYLGLDSLTDTEVAKSLGFLALSNIASCAGHIYNYQSDKIHPVNIYVDEAAECMNDACIRILNKGRGAGMRVTIATQTVADFVDILGSESKKDKVLGNVNTHICLRVQDNESRQALADTMGTTTIKKRVLSQGISTSSESTLQGSGSVGETLSEEDVNKVAPELLGFLPNLEYFANITAGKIIKGSIPIIGAKKESKPQSTVTNEGMFSDFSSAIDFQGESLNDK